LVVDDGFEKATDADMEDLTTRNRDLADVVDVTRDECVSRRAILVLLLQVAGRPLFGAVWMIVPDLAARWTVGIFRELRWFVKSVK